MWETFVVNNCGKGRELLENEPHPWQQNANTILKTLSKAKKREDGNENLNKNKIKKTLSEETKQEDDYENFIHGNETDINIKTSSVVTKREHFGKIIM